MRKTGVTYQGGGLWSSMTLAENVALPLEQYTSLGSAEVADLAALNLSLVGHLGAARADRLSLLARPRQ